MNGFISINKPVGMNSNKVLNIVKSKLRNVVPLKGEGAVRIGHLGTLDPDANGVLVVSIGKATRLFDLFKEKQKTYEAIFKFGIETDTLDNSGNITNTSVKIPTADEIKFAIKKFIGKQLQVPPQYSAIWVDGCRSYNLARKNVEFTLAGKEIEIFDINYIKQISNDEFLLEIVCSSGTYIRALCRDIAKYLGTFAIASSITRTKCGIFDLSNSLDIDNITFENIKQNLVVPSKVFPFIKQIEVTKEEVRKLVDGDLLKKEGLADGLYFIICDKNDIMLAELNDNYLKIKINLKENSND